MKAHTTGATNFPTTKREKAQAEHRTKNQMRRVLISGISAAFLALGGCNSGTTGSSKITMSREEFKQAVLWKTPEQVIAAVGRPDRTMSFQWKDSWFYKEVTLNPITGKEDGLTEVVIQNGRAEDVDFLL